MLNKRVSMEATKKVGSFFNNFFLCCSLAITFVVVSMFSSELPHQIFTKRMSKCIICHFCKKKK